MKRDKRNKDKIVSLWVSEAEACLLERGAQRLGVKRSEYIRGRGVARDGLYPGRPKPRKNGKRDRTISVRLNDYLVAMFKGNAKPHRMTLADWLRDSALAAKA